MRTLEILRKFVVEKYSILSGSLPPTALLANIDELEPPLPFTIRTKVTKDKRQEREGSCGGLGGV